MTSTDEITLKYYKSQGILSDIGKYTENTEVLPDDPAKLSEIVQGVILHDMWIGRYGVKPSLNQWCNVLTPSMGDLLETVVGIDHAEPFTRREPGERVIACCREFSTMLCGLLRAKGIPARARCGFAPYLAKDGYYEDHWMCEAWGDTKWRRIDPQIDSFQLETFQKYAKDHPEIRAGRRSMLLEFDPQNLKQDDFMIAGEAWLKCRSGELEEDKFGIGIDLSKYNIKSSYGLWFVCGNLIRDFLALNKIELLPHVEGLEKASNYWDEWPIMQPDKVLNEDELTLLDKIAILTLDPDKNLEEIQQLYADKEELHPPEKMLAKQ